MRFLAGAAFALLAACQPPEPDTIQFSADYAVRQSLTPGVVEVGYAATPTPVVRASCLVAIDAEHADARLIVETSANLGMPSCWCEWAGKPVDGPTPEVRGR